MKGTKAFEDTIKAYLDDRAATDELFAKSYAKEDKNLTDCITYIFNTVKASGCNGFSDDEVFSMAVHYYDEDNINVGSPMTSGSVVVNHAVELTEEELAQAWQKAMDKATDEAYAKLMTGSKPAKKKVETIEQPSLF